MLRYNLDKKRKNEIYKEQGIMRRLKTLSICFIMLSVLMLVLAASLSGQQSGDENRLPDQIDEGQMLAHTARYFAGQFLDEGNPLFAQTRVATYFRFRDEMNRYWHAFRSSTFERMRDWQASEAGDLARATIFYPFSGPDFLTVYAVYPEADVYIMVGLELGGLVPKLEEMPEVNLRRGLDVMVESFRAYIGFKFHRTLGMEADLNQSPFTGTLPHVMAQLAWLGITPLSVSSVEFTLEGKMVTTPLSRGVFTRSWQLECRSPAGKIMRIIYISQDLANEGLRRSPGTKLWLEALPPVSGFFRSAGYLPPREAFTEITRICLDKMRSIIQDDTAIPYRMLKDRFDVTVYGWYTRPHSLFSSFGQPDLAEFYRNSTRREINFIFQNSTPDDSRNLMVARRKAGL
jgi:hypothetical protein